MSNKNNKSSANLATTTAILACLCLCTLAVTHAEPIPVRGASLPSSSSATSALVAMFPSLEGLAADIGRVVDMHKLTSSLRGLKASNGAGKCVGCTLVASLAVEKALLLGEGVRDDIQELCGFVKNTTLHNACEVIDALLGSVIDSFATPKQSPDAICRNAGMCTNPQCVLFPSWPPKYIIPSLAQQPQSVSVSMSPVASVQSWSSMGTADAEELMTPEFRQLLEIREQRGKSLGDDTPGDFWDAFKQLLKFLAGGISANAKTVFEQHLPMNSDDVDHDRYSNSSSLRGYSWRGRDCNLEDATVHPGRLWSDETGDVDINCNGIVGVDKTSGQTYEEMFCGKSEPRGVIILGDSAAAHFHIPPAIFNASELDKNVLLDALFEIENEMDWPQCSWSTGFETSTNCPPSKLPIKSIYQRMRERNRCNHRDYQNIGVNGARTASMADNVMYSMSRNQTRDNPALVFFALIGNDVCNGHPGLSHMTTVADFEKNVLAALEYLDTQLPNGSHVVFVPLADGQILYDTLQNATHPLGTGYPAFYDYLACTGNTPCWGWMNTNATWRELTTQRARNLSAVYPKIMAEHKYEHFDMIAVPDGWTNEALQKWVQSGGNPIDFIEPVDGFHPSTTANMVISEMVWEWLEQNHPEALGPVNPFNAEIEKMFGDQGGH